MDNIKPCGLNKKSTKCNTTATLAGASAHQIDTKNKLGGKRLSDLHQIMCLLLSSVLSWTWSAASAALDAFIYCTNCTTSLHYYPATCGCCCCCNNMLSFPRMKGSRARVIGRCKICCVICHRPLVLSMDVTGSVSVSSLASLGPWASHWSVHHQGQLLSVLN